MSVCGSRIVWRLVYVVCHTTIRIRFPRDERRRSDGRTGRRSARGARFCGRLAFWGCPPAGPPGIRTPAVPGGPAAGIWGMFRRRNKLRFVSLILLGYTLDLSVLSYLCGSPEDSGRFAGIVRRREAGTVRREEIEHFSGCSDEAFPTIIGYLCAVPAVWRPQRFRGRFSARSITLLLRMKNRVVG